jgi:serine/threonine protein kinase
MDLQPDFTEYGYEVVQALGHNYGAERSTYLAKSLTSPQLVVVKLFRFPKSASQFSAYEKAIAREAQILANLKHPAIPCYLNGFDTPDGYCIVQEYKEAQSLASNRSLNLSEIQRIAIAALEVLGYLQSLTPPIIHRDIKPENLLVGDDLKFYLVDFGFARIGKTDVALSSVAAGTFGFMAPEQLRNQDLSEATDLYGLGMTLLCLLTGKRSTQIDCLIDEDNQIKFRHLLPNVNPRFVRWLEKMTAPRLKDRYLNAATALAALNQIGDIAALTSKQSFTNHWWKVAFCLLPVPAAIASFFTFLPALPSENRFSSSQSTLFASISSLPLPYLPSAIAITPTPIPMTIPNTRSSNLCSQYRDFSQRDKPEEQEANDSLIKLKLNRECRGCNFKGVRSMPRDLQGVNLENADLRRVRLSNTDLSGANLKGAKLEGTDFTQSTLHNADLSETTSKCATFTQTKLQNAKFVKADLTMAQFSQSTMTETDLSNANLTAARLSQTDLSRANLNNVDFTGAELIQTVLKDATMQGVIIKNTRMVQTNLPNESK